MTQTPPPAYSTGAAPHRGVLVLVLGILSIVVCAFLGPFAWIMGQGDMKKIAVGSMDPSGKGLTQAGMICGIIGTVLLALGLLYVIFVMVLGIGMVAAAGAAGAAGGN